MLVFVRFQTALLVDRESHKFPREIRSIPIALNFGEIGKIPHHMPIIPRDFGHEELVQDTHTVPFFFVRPRV